MQQREMFLLIHSPLVGACLSPASEGKVIKQNRHLPSPNRSTSDIYQLWKDQYSRLQSNVRSPPFIIMLELLRTDYAGKGWRAFYWVSASRRRFGKFPSFTFTLRNSLHFYHRRYNTWNEQRPDSIFVFSCISAKIFIGRATSDTMSLPLIKFCPWWHLFVSVNFHHLSLAPESCRHALTYLGRHESGVV